MNSRFDTCLNFVLDWEGRTLEFDPHDPGGVTFCGIDQRDHPGVDVKTLTVEGVRDIYYGLWTKFKCNTLPEPWDLLVFDSAVNPGPSFPIRAMQECLAVKVDGLLGPRTLAAVVSNSSVGGAFNAGIKCFIRKRLAYYANLPWRLRKHFADGWTNRTVALAGQAEVKIEKGVVV
jgi:lysozyme family protein